MQRRPGLDGDQREVAFPVGDVEAVRVERKQARRERLPVKAVLVVELGAACLRERCARQHVMVGEQQPGRDERTGPVPSQAPAAVPDHDPADRSRRRHARFQETDIEKIHNG
jgi:hypothetical protein